MYIVKRPRVQPIFVVLVVATLLLVACGAEVASQNWPGLTVHGDRVYVSYGAGVAAVDVAEQRLLWRYPEEVNPALMFYAAPSVSDERIVVGDFGASGGMFSPQTTVTIYAFGNSEGNSGTPSLLWSRNDVAHDRIIAAPQQTPDQVFVGTADNNLYALNAENGEVLWDFSTNHSIWAQPVFYEGTVFVASLDNSIYALDAESGEEKWTTELGGSIAGRPIVNNGLLYVSSFDRQLHALDVNTGEEQWSADAGNWVWGAPAVGDGSVFYADIDGNVYAVNAETGEQLWTKTVEGSIQTTPLFVNNVVYFATGETNGEEEARTGQLLALDAASGDELWRRETPAPIFTAPAVVDDSIVIVFQDGGQSRLQVYEPDDGAVAWEFTLPTTEGE